MTRETQLGKEQSLLWPSKILIAQPHGFCAGIVRSLEASQRLIEMFPGKEGYYVGEPAHNEKLVADFKQKGVIFVDDVRDVPDESIVGLGPHGSTPQDLAIAKSKGLFGINTECPLVTKVHRETDGYLKEDRTILYFAKEDHPEVIGILGHDTTGKRIIIFKDMADLLGKLGSIEIDPDKLAFITQTTHAAAIAISIQRELQRMFPNIKVPQYSDICYATQNRQDGVRAVVEAGAQAVVVLGSKHSSNTRELAELAKSLGAREFFVDNAQELKRGSFLGLSSVGITSGASVPEEIFQETLDWFRTNGTRDFQDISLKGVMEREQKMRFKNVVIGQF